MKSLANHLGIADPAPEPVDPTELSDTDIENMSVQDFCRGILRSRDYRKALLLRVRIGDLPPAIESLIYHYAEGKPVDRVEHMGKDGKPIQLAVAIKRIIIDPKGDTE